MPSGKPEPVKLIFELEHETKNKVRFQEVGERGRGQDKGEPIPKDKAVVEKLYVSKKKLKAMGDPTLLRVTIEAP